MADGITRRSVLQGLGTALSSALIDRQAQAAGVRVSTHSAQLMLTAPAPEILRIVFSPSGALEGADDGALDRAIRAPPELSIPLTGAAKTVRCGQFSVGIANDPMVLEVRNVAGRLVQRLHFAPDGSLGFDLGTGPLFGLGQGGPQFDRRGSFDRMRSGQAGFELATHGARVPIPWLIGTQGGWALFIHTPAGAFDLTGAEGRFLTDDSRVPIDLFLVSGGSPEAMMRAYGRITGLPEMPPLWSFGYQQSGHESMSWHGTEKHSKTAR